MIDYPRRRFVLGHMTSFKFWEVTDNILEMLEDSDHRCKFYDLEMLELTSRSVGQSPVASLLMWDFSCCYAAFDKISTNTVRRMVPRR